MQWLLRLRANRIRRNAASLRQSGDVDSAVRTLSIAIEKLGACPRRSGATNRLLAVCETDFGELAVATRREAAVAMASGAWQRAADLLASVAGNRRVARGLALDEHVAMIRGGRRAEAIAALRHSLAARPTDGELCHALAVACYYGASDGSREQAKDADHKLLLGSFAMILHHPDWWDEWGNRAAGRLGAEVSRADLAAARQEIEGTITSVLARAATAAPHWERWFQRERAAAARMADVGGIPTLAGPVVCGPWMSGELGLGASLASALDAADADDDAEDDDLWSDTDMPDTADVGDLRAWFSALGIPLAALSKGDARGALAALDELSCHRCCDRTARPDEDWQPRVCRASCPEFARENPWHAEQRHGRELLIDDAVRLRIDVLLQLARNAMTAKPMDAPSAARHLLAAMNLMRQREQPIDSVRRLLAGRVKALTEESRLDDAITLLDACGQVIGTDVAAELHADVLTDRGVRAGNAKPPAWDDAIRDLERAAELNPAAARAVTNLGIAMNGLASVLWNSDRPEEAIRILRAAHDRLVVAQQAFRGRPEVASAADDVAKALGTVLRDRAIALANAERFDDALALLADARACFPGDEEIEELTSHLKTGQRAHRMAQEFGGEAALRLQQKAVTAYNAERFEEAIQLLRQAIGKSRRPTRLHPDLSKVLATAAVARINDAAGQPDQGTCSGALEMLREAVHLDRSNKHARENLDRLQKLMRGLERAGAAFASLQEYGGAEAVELQQRAVRAFNADRKPEAAELLRRALRVANRHAKLKEELAMVLVGVALDKVAVSDWSGVSDLLEEATELDPSNAKARMMLELSRRNGR